MSNDRGDYRSPMEGATLRSPLSQPASFSITQLRAKVTGRVVAPADPAYDQARTIFYGGFDRRPSLIVQAADAADVARVVALARETGLELAVRSGGHSLAGHSVLDGGIVLDLSAMHALDIDTEARSAWAQAGLTAGDYTTAAVAHGLATGFGDTGSVGIGGITLAGGIGYLVRKDGLTIDNLLAAEVVTADGQVLRADAEDHPDLFWALRGGGGNFGVATRFQFRLRPLDRVLGGLLLLPATPEVLAGVIAAADAAPEELSGIVNVLPAPPMPMVPTQLHGQLVIMAMLVYAGPVEDGQAAVAPFRALATPLADMIQPMPYPQVYPPEDPAFHPTAIGHTMFIDTIDQPTAETILEHLRASDAPVRVAQLRVLGGAMARVPADATAFAHRGSKIMVNLASFYQGPHDQPVRQAWVEAFAAALRQGDQGAYVGFLGDEDQGRVHQAYPAVIWERLAEVKARYDPTNLFHHNHNIPPAT
jgi:FAD binding domain/Berberine and berberine like